MQGVLQSNIYFLRSKQLSVVTTRFSDGLRLDAIPRLMPVLRLPTDRRSYFANIEALLPHINADTYILSRAPPCERPLPAVHHILKQGAFSRDRLKQCAESWAQRGDVLVGNLTIHLLLRM